MRDLTQQEIKNAPEWATHYFIDCMGHVTFESELLWQRVGTLYAEHSRAGLSNDVKPVPRKAFDISEYKFSDCYLTVNNSWDDIIELACVIDFIDIRKNDAIAMAKHFKLTADELK